MFHSVRSVIALQVFLIVTTSIEKVWSVDHDQQHARKVHVFASYKGGTLKAPVKSGDNPRRASFLARMGNMAGPEYKNGKPTRLLLSLRAWGASSKADARKKARSISMRNKNKKKKGKA